MENFPVQIHLTLMRVLESVIQLRPLTFDLEKAREAFSGIPNDCKSLGLVASMVSAERIVKMLSNKRVDAGKFRDLAIELQDRMIDEMSATRFLALTVKEAAYYDSPTAGWQGVLERFPETTRDVEEMNKCFALGCYTAAMFHALHVAEWGAIKLGDYVGVTDPKKGWGPTEKALREIVKGGHSNLPLALAGKFEFLEQMNREISSMVLAWRHKVDHAANHLYIVPNTDFTPDIAEHIIGAVRIFMQRLIEGIPEGQGNAV
jgi:hypothetical protein